MSRSYQAYIVYSEREFLLCFWFNFLNFNLFFDICRPNAKCKIHTMVLYRLDNIRALNKARNL